MRRKTSKCTLRITRDSLPMIICIYSQMVAHVVEVDLMQPLDLDKKPAVHQTPLNHIGLWVDDLPKAVTWLTEQGLRFAPGGIRPGASGHDIIFVHPKGNEEFPFGGEGVLIELVQAPPEILAALS